MASWQLPGYDYVEPLAVTSRGQVWRAVRCADGERVVVRHVTAGRLEELRRVTAVTGAVGGPHLVPVHDVAADPDGGVAIVSAEVAGGSLAALLARRGPLAAGELVTLVAPLAQTLAELHRRGVVHGGVSTTSVLLTATGCPMWCDVGVHGGAAMPADDVCSLGRLARGAAIRAIPAALAAALDAATAPEPARRPGAAEWAAMVLRACPAAPIDLAPVAAHAADRPPDAGGPRRVDAADSGGRRVPVRPVVGLVAVVAVGAVAGRAWGSHDAAIGSVLPPTTTAPAEGRTATPGPVERSVAVAPTATPAANHVPAAGSLPAAVRRLVHLRVRALRTRDLQLLAEVYAAGPALAADRATVRSLLHRGLRARGFRDVVGAVHVEGETRHRAVVQVADELPAYVLVDGTGAVVARQAGRGRQLLSFTLRRTAAGWRIDTVSRARQ